MADDKFIDIEIEGEDVILAHFKRMEERSQDRTRRLLNDFTDAAVRIIQENVPVLKGYSIAHVGRSPSVYTPGGAGGGGSYEAVAVSRRGSSMHPLYVEIGTGIYGEYKRMIRPLYAKYMVFYGTRAGRWLGRKRVAGQKPQRYFYRSWRSLLIYADARVLAKDIIN
jgi:hypothetical protein